jgi:predicted DNA-binding transcriptional regulator AlpA
MPNKPLRKRELNLREDDPDIFWDMDELVQRNIVRSWSDLWVKQRDYGFPKGVVLAGRRRHFRAVDVRAWIKAREEA